MKLYLRNLEPGRDAEFSLEALEKEYTLYLQYTNGEMTSNGKMETFQEIIDARKIIKEFKYGDEKEVLIELNKKELPKLVEKTREIQNAIATINSDMSVMIEHLKNELDTLNELQRKFYLWFKSRGINIDLIKSFIGSDDIQNGDDKYKRLEKDYESLNNQLKVAHKKVVKYKRQVRYKTGHISDKSLEKMADSVRFKSSKIINFDKLGELLGCSGVTAKKVIADRLPYLLDPKDY